MSAGAGTGLGSPRVHLRRTDSTNSRGRALAAAGAPHGTLVTADEQTAGRGRQGRTWIAPAGRALLCSLVLRRPPHLLPLTAGVAVAEVCELSARAAATDERGRSAGSSQAAAIKWPNDVLLDGRKVAGILVEGRPQEGWAVLGVGVNVAVRPEDLPPELRDRATTLGLEPAAVQRVLTLTLERLAVWLSATEEAVLAAVRERDALLGRPVHWADGSGTGAGIDGDGRLVIDTDAGRRALDAGEAHLGAM